ncbi:hypothetical protein clP1_032 [Pediococcus phage cIP1]|uniref:Uncharacterized protein n=1 Tax=Pediococcus phage cIP1 TaxID=2681621 RepID=G8FV15_9CAUD|nr:hypothetical protein clP1_032 [Pediococcus phage cIP1]AER59791.1 hypothetical protein clP1_032 [Pediococcus phage cIP1]
MLLLTHQAKEVFTLNATEILDDLIAMYSHDSNVYRQTVSWHDPKAIISIEEIEPDVCYTVIVNVMADNSRRIAVTGAYEYDTREQAEQIAKELEEGYFDDFI